MPYLFGFTIVFCLLRKRLEHHLSQSVIILKSDSFKLLRISAHYFLSLLPRPLIRESAEQAT